MNPKPFLYPIDLDEDDILHGADLLISDPSRYAVALKYDESIYDAPFVVAKALGVLVDDFEIEAQERGISVFRIPDLSSELFAAVSVVGMQVPETFYEKIAEAFAYAYKVQGKLP